MKTNKTCAAFLIMLSVFVCFGLCGCGGGGGKNSDNGEVRAALSPGIIQLENGGSKNILVATVKGAGVSGGWVENQTGNKVGSNLSYTGFSNTYETVIENLPNGNYSLKYFLGSDQYELSKNMISWTALPVFLTTPTASWNSSSRVLSINLPNVSGSNPSFFVRLYNNFTGTLYDESQPQNAGLITMQVNSVQAEFRIVLLVEFIENDQVSSTLRYVFEPMQLN
jgi:hypothetical protein